MRARPRVPGGIGIGMVGTLGVHALAVAFIVLSAKGAHAVSPPTYAVRLVAAPDATPDQRKTPEAVQREAAAPPTPAPPTKAAVTPRPAPAAPPNADTKRREAAPRTSPPVQRIPGEAPSTGRDVATVSTEGQEFPFPEYLQNIVSQVLRRWQRPEQSTPLEAEVSFFVHKDGSVSGLQFTKRSGNFAFDLEAEGAVESAGQSKAFGGLPDGWNQDVLFVRFYFSGVRQ
ncbi:MAG TPA: TonB C-terminal domain-containing protein [Gemmatimonadales bacterium]|nr:TonB C-terminal domain-containing protein [Gemmatimonadales bacterium]